MLIPAAGAGLRFGGAVPKQYLELAGRPVIAHSIQRLLASGAQGLVVVIAGDDVHWTRLTLPADPRLLVTTGGPERIDSVRAGLERLAELAAPDDLVLVHDAVRPCVTQGDLDALLAAADHPDGAVLAVPVADTLKRVDEAGRVVVTVPRAGLWTVQTPQLFRFAMLRECLARAAASGRTVTDEAAAVEAAGYRPRIVQGRRDNIKITWPGDLALAAAILATQDHS